MRHKKALPVLISNIPIFKGKRIISYELKPEHLLGVERLPEKCVVLIDEVSLWLSQMDYKIQIATSATTLLRCLGITLKAVILFSLHKISINVLTLTDIVLALLSFFRTSKSTGGACSKLALLQ